MQRHIPDETVPRDELSSPYDASKVIATGNFSSAIVFDSATLQTSSKLTNPECYGGKCSPVNFSSSDSNFFPSPCVAFSADTRRGVPNVVTVVEMTVDFSFRFPGSEESSDDADDAYRTRCRLVTEDRNYIRLLESMDGFVFVEHGSQIAFFHVTHCDDGMDCHPINRWKRDRPESVMDMSSCHLFGQPFLFAGGGMHDAVETNFVKQFDLEKMKVVGRFLHGDLGYIEAVDAQTDSNLIFGLTSLSWLLGWDVRSAESSHVLKSEEKGPSCGAALVFCADLNVVVANGSVFDVRMSEKCLRRLSVGLGDGYFADLTRISDHRIAMLYGGEDCTVVVSDFRSGKKIAHAWLPYEGYQIESLGCPVEFERGHQEVDERLPFLMLNVRFGYHLSILIEGGLATAMFMFGSLCQEL